MILIILSYIFLGIFVLFSICIISFILDFKKNRRKGEGFEDFAYRVAKEK